MVSGNEQLVTLIGYAAGTLTTAAFVPQLLRVLRTRSTRDISLLMFLTVCAGQALWTCYGVMLHSMPMILANSLTLALACSILLLKFRYERAEASARSS